MKKIIASMCALCLFVSFTASAQQATISETPAKKEKGGHGLGLILSSSNGKGLSYRYWPEIYGLHVSFVPADLGDEQYYNGGLTGYARIKRYSLGDLFMHVGTEYEYRSRVSADYDYMTGEYTEYRVNGTGVNFGFGPGFHVTQKGFSFDIYAGYGGYWIDESSSDSRAQLNDRFLMTFSGGIAIYLDL
jgi:hypothetical protein